MTETIMTLITECGVSKKVNKVIISVVVKILTGKTLSRLPSTGVNSWLMIEAKRVSKSQVATEILENQKGIILHQDDTSKHHKQFQ
jgi:hypothetical protein